ncbi:MAG: hypothetical protein ACJA01_002842 [Saprospiraceae bacterium]
MDLFKTDRPKNIQVVWHYAPDNVVIREGIEALLINSDAPNLRIVPVGNIQWDLEIVEGQEIPFK